ncbi:hypothetical protein QTN24_15725 [Cupriavidus sp. SZY C1]|uniref:hypothetical protein n=1 Tax=Cupriavidus sp. SZY C1 TaxID=3055037 RepID=UPI0028B79B1C|nr:hypothetical protein [Cupriavidus sp. SZY C1]MDT6962947.1 hypothetical protein [Cupriavidus sp. SZY C1]
MKKLLLSVALIASTLFPLAAHALDFEVGAGVARYTTRGNMMWYQEGFPHTLDLNAPAFEAGLADNFYQNGRFGIDWHASYVYMGNVHSDAIATPVDSNYDKVNKTCFGECYAMSRYVANGHNQGIKLTIEPNYTYMGWRFGLEAGAYIFRPTWHATVYDVPPCKTCEPQTLNVASDSRIQVAPVVGVSIGRGGFSVAALHYFNKTRGDPTFPIWKSTTTLMLKYRF